MSLNQSRSDKNDSHFRKPGGGARSTAGGSGAQQRTFTGGPGRGGAPPNTAPNLSTNWSFKKNNAQGGQSRGAVGPVNPSDPNAASVVRFAQCSGHVQSTLHGVSNIPAQATISKPTDASAQNNNRPLPKAPPSQASPVTSCSNLPSTPEKVDGAKPFSLQFGSLSPGFVGMQVPPRTSSAPPKLDEQKRDQVRRDAPRTMPSIPLPSAPKPEAPKKNIASSQRPVIQETHTEMKAKRDMQVTSVSPPTQPQKPSALPVAGISMPLPYYQPPTHFVGPNPQIQSQGMQSSSLQMGMMPLHMGSPSQVPQQVYMPGYQHHLIQTQGFTDFTHQVQSQNFGFSHQMGTHLTHQLGTVGINSPPQFNQQLAGNVISNRKTVKIIDPVTGEEVRLDSKDNMLTGSRSHHNSPPQSQALPNFISTRPIGPPAFPVHNSVSLSSTQSTAGSQVPRSNYSVAQAPPISVNKKEAPVQGKPGSFILDNNIRDVQEKVPPARPTSTRVTIKAAGFSGDKFTNFNTILEAKPRESLNSVVRTGAVKKDSELKADSSLAAPASVVTSALGTACASPIGSPRASAYLPSHVDAIKSTSDGNIQKLPEKTRDFQQSPQDSGNSSAVVVSESAGASMGFTSSVLSEGVSEAVQSPIISVATPSDVSCGDRGREGSYLSESSELQSVVKPVEDQYAKQSDLHLQEKTTVPSTVSEEGKKELPGVMQSDIPLKIMDDVGKTDQDGEIKKVDHVAVVKGASQTAVEAPSCSEGDNASSTDSKECVVSDSSSSVGIVGGVRSKEYEGDNACVFDVKATSISANHSEADVGQTDPILNTRPSSSSGIDSGLIKTKNNKGKKWKEMLQKADASGTTDLYMAYKGPEEKKEFVASEITSERNSEEVSANVKQEASTGREDDQSKSELDNWEDAADISTPKLRLPGKGEEGGTVKKYPRDFILTFSEQCTTLPVGFEMTFDISHALMRGNDSASHGDHEIPSPGKIIDRPTGAARRGNGAMDTDNRWSKVQGPYPSGCDSGVELGHGSNVTGFRTGLVPNHGVLRNPRAQGPGQPVGGILSGPMHSSGFQGMQRNYSDADRWQRATNYNKGLMPAPQTPLQVMHKAEKKYEVGKISDEEQAKQRKLKSILNRLTPQNFEKLFEQVKEVNIDNDVTLTGVISQIFDKALMEPTFCEMYANFCSHLATELPDLSVDNEKITFRRLLLNKCQEEFERGEREEQEANEADGEGEIKQSEQGREEKRLKVRRRMLGNIRLIGELYKEKMLTERIMHECINKLLGDYHSPDEENIEALCKLMSTIGEMIDHPKAKDHMNAYFDIMRQLSNNMNLSSRVRFMLRDSIDLRKNKWQQRRKVEGPKKIDEVHRDAVQERLGQTARLSRGPSMNPAMRRGQPVEFSSRGPMLSTPVGQGGGSRGTSQVRGYAMQDARTDDRNAYESRTLSVPLLQRSGNDQPITLGPQGGLARGMAFKGQPSVSSSPLLDTSASYGDPKRTVGGPNGYSATLDRGAYSSREGHFARHSSERFGGPGASDQSNNQEHNANRDLRNPNQNADESRPTMPSVGRAGGSPAQNLSSETVWPEERLREKSIAAIKEYYSAKDEKEIALCMNELNAPSFYPVVVSTWVSDSFERKDKERDSLAQLLVNLTKPQEGLFTPAQLIEGFQSVLSNLEDTVNDAPRAPEFLGRIFGNVVVENVITLKEVGQLIHEGGEELGSLLQAGLAGDVLGSILEMIKSEKGESTMNEIRAASNLKLEDFRPPGPIKSRKLEMFIKG